MTAEVKHKPSTGASEGTGSLERFMGLGPTRELSNGEAVLQQ
jgi:hypothetical protein